jgi:predicted AAA+ superfamily ATPase
LEKKNYSENLLKTINITLEIDILLLKQIELSYLPKIRKLLYLLASNEPAAPNISQLSLDIQTSRATVMNYIKYLKDARMLNILYPKDENFPKKPSKVYLQNTNLMYAFWPALVSEQAVRETFFYNSLIRDHKVNKGEKNAQFLIDGEHNFCIVNKDHKIKRKDGTYFAVDALDKGDEDKIPLWLFGFLY